jgi:hypothetical protein
MESVKTGLKLRLCACQLGSAIALSLVATPAQADVLAVMPVSYRIDEMPASTAQVYRIDSEDDDRIVVMGRSKHELQRRELTKWEVAYQTLNVIDAVQTIVCTQSGKCREANPLLGSRPSIGKVILFKAGIGLLNFVVLEHTFKSNPEKAIKGAKVSTIIQAGMVTVNMRFAF